MKSNRSNPNDYAIKNRHWRVRCAAWMGFILMTLTGSTAMAQTLPGAHSATISTAEGNEVFLGGNYIEVGISAWGSFGTVSNKPAGFFGTAVRNNVGMSADMDGFGVGNDYRIDFFLPGTPEERWYVGYKIGASTYFTSNSALNGGKNIPTTVTDLSSGTELKALITSTYNSNLEIKQTVSFQADSKYFMNQIQLKNVGTSTLDSVRFMRSFDPDNTVDQGGSYDTENEILYQYDATDQKSVVRAQTYSASDPIFTATGSRAPIVYYSQDSTSRVSLGYGSLSVGGGIYDSRTYDSAPAAGTSEQQDSCIAICYDVGTLAPGETATFSYYTSLDERDMSEVIGDIVEHTITASVDGNGTISPAGATTVVENANQTFIITPDPGYEIADVTVDGSSVGATSVYTFYNVTGNHTITAHFAATPVGFNTILATSEGPGTISPSGSVTFATNSDESFTITPNLGAVIVNVVVDGEYIGPVTSVPFSSVSSNHTVHAIFEPDTSYTVTASAGANGSITPAGAVSVYSGYDQTFTIEADSGYTIADVTVDGSSVGAVSSYTFNNVLANHTISATFAEASTAPTLTCSGGTTTVVCQGANTIVDAGITLTGTDPIDGVRVSVNNYQSGDILEFDASSLPSGVSGSWNSSTGVLVFTGAATPAQWQTLLRTVSMYTNATSAGTRTVSFTLGGSLPSEDTGHYYEFVSSPGISWTDAQTAASARSLFGMQGYLVTVTSAEENTFVFGKLTGQGWMGASDAASETIWRWVTGPEGLEDGGAGRHFFTQTSGGTGGTAVGTYYNNWASGEPNNAGDEDYAHFLTNGQWNDYPLTLPSIDGYVVEYGGMPGDPTLQISDTKDIQIAYTVTATAGTNGSLNSGTPSPVTVNHGSTATFTFDADTGYHVASVSGCSGSTYTNTSNAVSSYTYTTGPITGNCSVTASFAINQYTVTATADTHGSLNSGTPSPVTVNYGNTATFTFDADTGYHVASVSGCSGTPYSNTSNSVSSYTYTTGPITADCTVDATFAINTYTVTATAGTNGSLDGTTPSPVTVDYGDTATFTFNAVTGYHVASVSGCSGTPYSNTSNAVSSYTYTTGPITADCTVDATFAINRYTVTATAGDHGSLDGSTPSPIVVNYGDTPSFTFNADTGYHVASVSGCFGSDYTNDTNDVATYTYTTGPITADCTVDATFAINRYTVTAVAGANGSVSPEGVTTVTYGSSLRIEFLPDTGYRVKCYYVDQNNFTDGDSEYWFSRISQDHIIEVVFDSNIPPVITSFECSNTIANAPHSATFDVEAYDPENQGPLSYGWLILNSDGEEADLAGESHFFWKFLRPGDYDVYVLVTDSYGASTLSDPIHITVQDAGPITLPLITQSQLKGTSIPFSDATIWLLNTSFETATVNIEYLDNDSKIVIWEPVYIPPLGKQLVELADSEQTGYQAVRAVSEQHILAQVELKSETAVANAYLTDDLTNGLTVPHIPEDTDTWRTWTLVSDKAGNNYPTLSLEFLVDETFYKSETSFLHVTNWSDLEESGQCTYGWSMVKADPLTPFTDAEVLTGLQSIISKDSDAVGLELPYLPERLLYIPHIPNSTGALWSGLAIVNPNKESALVTLSFFSSEGKIVDQSSFEINSRSKWEGLIDELSSSTDIEWATIRSDLPVFGTLISGNDEGAMFGLTLDGQAINSGTLPLIKTHSDEWTHLVLTNTTNQRSEVRITLRSSDGIQKGEVLFQIDPYSKSVNQLSELFPDVEILQSDACWIDSSQPLCGFSVSGNSKLKWMTALKLNN